MTTLERPRDADGITYSGWIHQVWSTSGTGHIQIASGSVGTAEGVTGDAFWEFTPHQDTGAGDIVLYPIPVGVGGKPRFLTTLLYRQTRLPAGTPILVEWLGVERNMMPYGIASGLGVGADACALLVPWEDF